MATHNHSKMYSWLIRRIWPPGIMAIKISQQSIVYLCLKYASNNSWNSATQISKQLHNLTIFQRFVALATISMPGGQEEDTPIPTLGLGRRGANHLTFGFFFNHFYSTAAPLIGFWESYVFTSDKWKMIFWLIDAQARSTQQTLIHIKCEQLLLKSCHAIRDGLCKRVCMIRHMGFIWWAANSWYSKFKVPHKLNSKNLLDAHKKHFKMKIYTVKVFQNIWHQLCLVLKN
jgi:hypothetical protein